MQQEANEDLYQMLISEAPMATAVYLLPDMIIRLANPAMLRLWGKNETVIGKKLRDALPELEGQPFHELLKKVGTSGKPYHATGDRADLVVDGVLQSYYFNFTYKPLFDKAGRVYAILNMAVDVTDMVRVKKQLLDEQETTRLALDAAELGTWVLDPLNNIVEWDERCKALFGFPKEDVIAYTDVLKHIHDLDREKVDHEVQRALDPFSDGNYFIEFRTIGADKKLRWLRCKGKAYFNAENFPYRFAGTAQDISAEIEQKNEQEKLFRLLENSYDFVGMADVGGRMIYVNQAGRKLLGLNQNADISKLNAADFYSTKQIYPNHKNLTPQMLDEGKWQAKTFVRNFTTKEVIPVQAEYILLDDSEGNLWGRGAILHDLRPELEAKKALEEHERLLEVITTEAPIALWMSDEKGMITYANQTWLKWTGTSYEEQLGTGWLNALLEEDRENAINSFLKSIELREQCNVDYRVRHTDGTIRWTTAKGNPRFDVDGRFMGYVGSTTDITQQVVAEKQLQVFNAQLNHQIRQFEFVTDVMPQIVWATRADGYHDFYNQRWYEFTGLTYEETKDTGWSLLLHADDLDRTVKAWNHSLKTGEPYDIEYRMRRADGEYRWLLARALPLFDDHGEVVKWFGTCTDIHEQKLLERQKDDFLGIASHELKTPVTSIKAYAQVLESILAKKGDEKEAGMVSKMNGQINRLTNLIGDLLDVTKINSGRLQFNKSRFAFNEMVYETVEELQRTTSRHQIICKTQGEAMVFGDRERIGQVLTNMITNAIKYSPHSDRIIIRTSYNDHEFEVCVQDFGVGISEKNQEMVFEQFYRVSGDMQHTFPGLGLGLYISSEIVKREGGRIWVNSIEGSGSTFCFTIPLKAS